MRAPRLLAIGLLVLACALTAGALRRRAMSHFLATQRYEDVYYLPPKAWLPVMSLGYREALADFIWMKALVYFGDEMVEGGRVAHVFDYGDAMLELDPDFRAVYRWVGVAGMYRPVDVTVDDIRRSIEFLERGARRMPEDGELAWDLGASYCYELAPRLPPGPERDAARERGATFLMAAARRGAGPAWLALSSAQMLLTLGHRERAIQHLEEMYAITTDEDMRERIAHQIAEERSAVEQEAAMASARAFEAERRANFPYLPSTLYLLVGPRIVHAEGASAPSRGGARAP